MIPLVVLGAIEKIGDRLLIVDLIAHADPRTKTVSRVEVTDEDLQKVLTDHPHLAQLALF